MRMGQVQTLSCKTALLAVALIPVLNGCREDVSATDEDCSGVGDSPHTSHVYEEIWQVGELDNDTGSAPVEGHLCGDVFATDLGSTWMEVVSGFQAVGLDISDSDVVRPIVSEGHRYIGLSATCKDAFVVADIWSVNRLQDGTAVLDYRERNFRLASRSGLMTSVSVAQVPRAILASNRLVVRRLGTSLDGCGI
jgi:hypothetical protein